MRIKTVDFSDRTKSVFFFSSLHPKGVNVYNLVIVAKQPLQMPASIFCANVLSLWNKSPDFLCYVCTMKTIFFALTDTRFSWHDLASDQRITSWVLNDGQFWRGSHWWWNSTITQLLSPCRTVDAGEKVSLKIRKLGS